MGVHIDASWRIRLNRPCAAAMRPFCQITLTTCCCCCCCYYGCMTASTGQYVSNTVQCHRLCFHLYHHHYYSLSKLPGCVYGRIVIRVRCVCSVPTVRRQTVSLGWFRPPATTMTSRNSQQLLPVKFASGRRWTSSQKLNTTSTSLSTTIFLLLVSDMDLLIYALT